MNNHKTAELAKTLKIIKSKGAQAFYTGAIAETFVEFMKTNNGIISLDDLQHYEPKWRKIVSGSYKGYTIASMPPPSSGGIALIQTLNILELKDLHQYGLRRLYSIISEALKFTYADRSIHLGDSDFSEVPIEKLTSKICAKKLASKISLNDVINVEALGNVNIQEESSDTTHFVVADKYGNVVSNTYTLNFSFGNGILIPKLGFTK